MKKSSTVRKPKQASALLLALVARISGWLGRWMRRWSEAPAKLCSASGSARAVAAQWEALRSGASRWKAARAARKVDAAAHTARAHFEPFEPRILMSADLVLGAQLQSTLTNAELNSFIQTQALNINLTTLATDADGTEVSVAFTTGPGSAELEAQGDGYLLKLSGTDATTELTLNANGGDGKVKLTGIEATGPLAFANLIAADLQGTATFEQHVAALTLGELNGADLQLQSAGNVLLKTGAAVDSHVHAPLASVVLSAPSWGGNSTIEVAALRSLGIGANFNANLLVNANGVSGFAVNIVNVTGAASGVWNIQGRSNSVQVGSSSADWKANFAQPLSQLYIRGQAEGQVSAAAMQILQVGGDMSGFKLLIGADLGADAMLGGSGENADSFNPGTLARLRVSGDIVDSHIAVSVNPVNDVLLDGDDQMLGTAANRVQELLVGGELLGSTRIVAPAFPAMVRVNGSLVDPASLPQLATSLSDEIAPTLSAALVADTGTSNADGITNNPAIAGQASDNVDVTQLLVALDPVGDTPTFSDQTAALAADGSFTLSQAALDTLAGGALTDGAHTVRIVAADAAGNQSAPVDVSFTLDTSAPTLSSFGLAPVSDTGTIGDNITSAETVTLVGAASPGATVALIAPVRTTTAAADGSFSFANIALVLGDNSFEISLSDEAGNTATGNLSVNREPAVVVDDQAPSLSAALFADTGASNSDGITSNPAIAGQAGDNIGVTQLLVALDPGATPTFTDLSAELAADGSFTISQAALEALAGGSLAAGAHTVRIIAADAEGNQSPAVNVNFTFDASTPTLSSFSLAASDASNAGLDETGASKVQLKGQAESGATVTLASQGIKVVAGAGGAFVMPGVALNVGANELTLSIIDAAGNAGSDLSRTITRNVDVQTDAILTWNDIALRAIQLDVTDPPVATRTLAMVSLAQYDALAAIEGSPAYLVQLSVSGPVSVDAAVATAAHRILSAIYPAQKDIFDAALTTSLAGIADGTAKDTGIALGLSVADSVIAARSNDGANSFANYPGSTALGVWRPTGPAFELADDPQWRYVTPFALTSPSQFRPAAPPALNSAAYAKDVEEVKRLGSATSTERTADQTEQAQFWADGAGSFTP
ncbi:MAG: Ig-like domain-containing protein, partial [Burkholderiaceae bacterium]|nr:Ig-like domain-containing protein [Burkholderiaceae bacterium]